jgi:zinc protease
VDVRIAAGIVAVGAAFVAAAAAGEPETFVLPNGLRVVLQVEDTPLVHVHVYYPVGPQTEPEGLEGIAHYLEHMMFQSSESFPEGELASELELLTTRRGGSTHGTFTAYDSECIPELLRPLLRLEADRMGALAPTTAELEREKGIVLEEIAYRSHWSPGTQLWLEVYRASFPGHPLGRPIAGTTESIEGIDEAEYREYQAAYHGPTGAVLVVVGDFDPVVTRRLIEDSFGPIPANPAPPPDVPALPEPPAGAVVEIDRYDDTGYVAVLGFRLPRETDRDFVLARLVEDLIDSRSFGARLRATWQEYHLTLTTAWAYSREDWFGNPKPIDAATDAKDRYQKLWERLQERLDEELKAEPFEDLQSDTVARYRRVRGNPSHAAEIAGRRWILDEQFPPVARFEELVAALTPADVRDYVAAWIHPSRSVYGVSHGKDSGRFATLPPPSRLGDGEGVALVPARLLTAERVEPRLDSYRRRFSNPMQTRRLSNGLVVHSVPVRGATYGMITGVRTFPPLGDEKKGKKRGITWAYNRLLRTVTAESEDDPKLPPSLYVRASPADFRYRASSTPGRLAESIRAMHACLENERLDVKRWKDVHRWMDSAPRDLRLRAAVRADLERWEHLFGEKSATLGRFVPETAEGKKLGYEHMQKLHEKLRKAEGLRLFVAADPEHLEVGEVLEETFGRGKTKERKKPEPPESSLEGIRGAVLSEFQEKDVELTVAFPPFAVRGEGDPAWAEAELSRLVVGKRLLSRMREQEGLVYYCFVSFRWVGDAFVPEITTASRPDEATRVYRLLREEITALVDEGLEEADLMRARLSLVKRRARWWSSPSGAYSDFVAMARHGDPPVDPVAAVLDAPPDAVQRALETWLDPERYSFTLVGPLLEEEIERF